MAERAPNIVSSKGSLSWKGYIPARWQDRLGHGRYFQRTLMTRDPKVADALGRYLNTARDGLIRLLDETRLSDDQIRFLVENFLDLPDMGDRGQASRPHLLDQLDQTADRERGRSEPVPNRPAIETAIALLQGYLTSNADGSGPADSVDGDGARQNGALRLPAAIREYLRERKDLLSPHTWTTYDLGLRTFLEFMGDRPLSGIGRADLREYKAAVAALPKNWRRLYPGVPVRDVLGRQTGGSTIGRGTVNTYLTHVSALFTWAHTNGFLDRNPAKRLKSRLPNKPHEERASYSVADLSTLFERSQTFRAVQNSISLAHRKYDPKVYHRFWMPLIALYSGMRAGEIGGLLVGDIELVAGVWVFLVRPNRHRPLKSRSARRMIPLHPTLLDLGLLKAVKQHTDSEQADLWPRLPVGNSYRQTSGWSSYWATYLQKSGVAGQGKCFHSFRHTFIERLLEVEQRTDLISDLTGHAFMKSETYSRYRKAAQAPVLLSTLSRVTFPISLTHLEG